MRDSSYRFLARRKRDFRTDSAGSLFYASAGIFLSRSVLFCHLAPLSRSCLRIFLCLRRVPRRCRIFTRPRFARPRAAEDGPLKPSARNHSRRENLVRASSRKFARDSTTRTGKCEMGFLGDRLTRDSGEEVSSSTDPAHLPFRR